MQTALVLASCLAPDAIQARPPGDEKPVKARAEPTNVDMPAFPQVHYRDMIDLRVQSRFVPASDLGGAEVDLYRPDLRLRVTTPVSQRAVLQAIVQGGPSIYDFSGAGDFLGLGDAAGDPVDDLYRAGVSLQGAYLITDDGDLFTAGERWSLLGAVAGRFRWESGAFEDSGTGDGSIGVGYQLPGRLRVAAGLSIGSTLDGGGARVKPMGAFRWRATKKLTVRNRGQGLQIEYRLDKKLEVFVSSFLDGQSFRLSGRPGFRGATTFRDRQVLAGVGLEWKISSLLRFNAEVGAVAWRELRVNERGGGAESTHADPSAYVEIRLGLRP